MRTNYETCICGKSCILVPYRPEHIKTYHEWMKDPYLLEMTGSEPLSLEEEIQMQESWKNDKDKCTFIILNKEVCQGIPEQQHEKEEVGEVVNIDKPEFITENMHAMIGDVNLFLSNTCTNNNDNENDTTSTMVKEAELDVMVAMSQNRRKGIGKEAACLMIYYGITFLDITRFFVKIKKSNTASLKLFQEALHFEICGYAECFHEYELEFIVNDGNQSDFLCRIEWYSFRCNTSIE